ncbi:MAG: symmetrical bis(5'-nucleosyl)-tetraphosphatase [Myxococcota bacterium]
MVTYAIGDIQGCYKTFSRLLKRINFDASSDKLWLAGDLINRGPKSLDILRFVKDLGDSAVPVLGNHEIYLMALHYGVMASEKPHTMHEILNAPDAHELVEWVRTWPLMRVQGLHVLVHAGLIPCWSVQQARREASAIESILQSEHLPEFLAYAYAHQDSSWHEGLQDFERQALALHAFVHMRLCIDKQRLLFGFSGEPKDAPAGSLPWFMIPGRESIDHQILFGHWSALGLRAFANCVALDSGCVWGQSLSAYRLEDGAIFVEASAES